MIETKKNQHFTTSVQKTMHKMVLLRYKYSEYVQCLAYQISRNTSYQG